MSKLKFLFISSLLLLVIAIASVYIFSHIKNRHEDIQTADTESLLNSSDVVTQVTPDPCQENITLLQTKTDQFKADTGSYPTVLTVLVDKQYTSIFPECPDGNRYSIDKDGKVFADSNYKNTEEKEEEKTFSKEELAQFDGKDGRKCYVALYGAVYDLTNVKGWKKGNHGHGIIGGKDWTALFEKHAPKSHRNPEFLKKLPVVGKYVGEPNPNTTLQKGH